MKIRNLKKIDGVYHCEFEFQKNVFLFNEMNNITSETQLKDELKRVRDEVLTWKAPVKKEKVVTEISEEKRMEIEKAVTLTT